MELQHLIEQMQQEIAQTTILDRALIIVGTLCFASLMFLILSRKKKAVSQKDAEDTEEKQEEQTEE